MEATISDLLKRIEKLENQMRAKSNTARSAAPQTARPLTAAEWGAIAVADAEQNGELDSLLLSQALTEMGFTGEPISREELFKRYEGAGFDPQATEFSQGIVAMRDEE